MAPYGAGHENGWRAFVSPAIFPHMTLRYATPEERLAAWTARDKAADGAFYVAVRTTRIYCRPSCPARPKVENLIWFSDKLSAEVAGYRACKRCRP